MAASSQKPATCMWPDISVVRYELRVFTSHLLQAQFPLLIRDAITH